MVDFSIGDRVSLEIPMPYLKTVDNIPMIRPPDLVSLEEVGEILGIRPNGLLEISFRRGKFLIPSDRLKLNSQVHT